VQAHFTSVHAILGKTVTRPFRLLAASSESIAATQGCSSVGGVGAGGWGWGGCGPRPPSLCCRGQGRYHHRRAPRHTGGRLWFPRRCGGQGDILAGRYGLQGLQSRVWKTRMPLSGVVVHPVIGLLLKVRMLSPCCMAPSLATTGERVMCMVSICTAFLYFCPVRVTVSSTTACFSLAAWRSSCMGSQVAPREPHLLRRPWLPGVICYPFCRTTPGCCAATAACGDGAPRGGRHLRRPQEEHGHRGPHPPAGGQVSHKSPVTSHVLQVTSHKSPVTGH